MCLDELELHAVLHLNPAAAARRSEALSSHAVDDEGGGAWGVETMMEVHVSVMREVCRELGVRLVLVPFDVGSTQNHQILLEWVWHNEVLPKYAGADINIVFTEVLSPPGACHASIPSVSSLPYLRLKQPRR
jgi:hypothetical protein